MYFTPIAAHSSAHCTMPSGSFGEMITSASLMPGTVRIDSSPALAIAPV